MMGAEKRLNLFVGDRFGDLDVVTVARRRLVSVLPGSSNLSPPGRLGASCSGWRGSVDAASFWGMGGLFRKSTLRAIDKSWYMGKAQRTTRSCEALEFLSRHLGAGRGGARGDVLDSMP